jgi:arylsulfatase A-like enzyme
MKSNRKLILFLIIALFFGGIFLLWPLTSDRFVIRWDQELISKKKKFLQFHKVKKTIPGSRPNIILIIVDDLGNTDISLYGPGKVNTPHIDRLGMDGVIFQQAYVTSPVCSPSRAAIFTGRYPQRFGFTYQMHDFYLTNRLMHYGYRALIDSDPWKPRPIEQVPSKKMALKQGLPPSEITLAELLKKEGYRTALVGKWHLGSHKENTPCNFGFDYQYGFYASHSLYAYENKPGIINQRIKNDFSDKYIWEGQRKGPHAIYRNCELVHEDEYLTTAITRECKSFIKSNNDTSFFLIASYNAPHTPLQAPTDYVEQFKHIQDPVKKVYYGMIRALDNEIGDLLDFLENENLLGNTLIFFISDNGGATYTHTTDNAPLRGGKITDFEGGINVPMIMYWKDQVPPGRIYPFPVTSMDIFGTIVSQLDIDLPSDRKIDGVDLIQFLGKESSGNMPHPFIYWNRGNTKAIRSIDYKLIFNTEFGDTLLFNMSKNNLEKENISEKNREIIRDLLSQYSQWEDGLAEPLWPPLIYYVYEENGNQYYFDN